MWATCPRLDFGIDLLKAWGYHYRGVAFNWIKCRPDGGIIGSQGIRSSFTKPTSELILVGSTEPKGRTLKISDETILQVVKAPRLEHSRKPSKFQKYIELMYPDYSKAELFARRKRKGWACWGNEIESDFKL